MQNKALPGMYAQNTRYVVAQRHKSSPPREGTFEGLRGDTFLQPRSGRIGAQRSSLRRRIGGTESASIFSSKGEKEKPPLSFHFRSLDKEL